MADLDFSSFRTENCPSESLKSTDRWSVVVDMGPGVLLLTLQNSASLISGPKPGCFIEGGQCASEASWLRGDVFGRAKRVHYAHRRRNIFRFDRA